MGDDVYYYKRYESRSTGFFIAHIQTKQLTNLTGLPQSYVINHHLLGLATITENNETYACIIPLLNIFTCVEVKVWCYSYDLLVYIENLYI